MTGFTNTLFPNPHGTEDGRLILSPASANPRSNRKHELRSTGLRVRLPALVLFAAVLPAFTQPQIEVPLRVTDGVLSDTLYFGIFSGAQYCIDPGDSMNGHVEMFLIPPEPFMFGMSRGRYRSPHRDFNLRGYYSRRCKLELHRLAFLSDPHIVRVYHPTQHYCISFLGIHMGNRVRQSGHTSTGIGVLG